ncbi:MAG: hypothetical protein AMDU5_GPLC00010G0059 [Thermoplasmatales archaeon Gpl]|jgi:hypothetical protein|nr:MAG: hypothetical protein AMDU5_GPLC00010G0059 [Thermoplasmatales archaeon Gpl]
MVNVERNHIEKKIDERDLDRPIATLVYFLRESRDRDPWETSQKRLYSLSRVGRIEITFGKEHKI